MEYAKARLSGLLLALSILTPSAKSAAAEQPYSVCWVEPSAVKGSLRKRFRAEVEKALTDAAPDHVAPEVRRAPSIRRAPADCEALVDLTATGPMSRAKLTLRILKPEVKDPRFDVDQLDLRKDNAVVLGVMSDFVWERVAPPAPPPPPPPPPEPEPFVDEQLETLKAEAAAAEAPRSEAHLPVASISASAGMLRRTVDSPLGAQAAATLPAVGVQLSLHVGRWLPANQDLDLDVAYHRQLGTAQLSGTDIALTADRFRATGVYRWSPGAMLPRFGPLVGFELQRFELDDPETLSTRHGVMRLGGSVQQPILQNEELDLRVEVLGAARLSPGSEGVASSVGFDVGGGVSADLGMGLHLAVSAAVRQAGGDVGGEDYSERFIDALGELGWVF